MTFSDLLALSVVNGNNFCSKMGWFAPGEAAQEMLDECESTSVLDFIPKQARGNKGYVGRGIVV